MAVIESLLQRVNESSYSDLHVQAGSRPRIRARGHLIEVEELPILESESLEKELLTFLTPSQTTRLADFRYVDFAMHNYFGRQWRVHYFYQESGLAAAFRPLPVRVQSFAELNLPEELERFAHFPSGLVLISGATGAGKTTTLASLVQLINSSYRKTINTLEDPVEYIYEDKRSVIQQREIGTDVSSFDAGIKEAMTFYPDALVIGEILDYETARMTLRAAETGMLVLATIHGNDAAQTIDRVLDLFPDTEQFLARTMIAQCLKAICCQLLVPDLKGVLRVPVCEILIRTPAIGHLIRSNRVFDLRNHLQTGKALGMRHLDQSLSELVDAGILDVAEARRYATDKRRFRVSLAQTMKGRRTSRSMPKMSGKSPASERRGQIRRKTTILANVSEYDEAGKMKGPLIGPIFDLSSISVSIELNQAFAIKNKVRIELALGAKTLQFDAVVRSVRNIEEGVFAIGFRFLELDMEAQDSIDLHLRLHG
jgi:twitching motility protein PilT